MDRSRPGTSRWSFVPFLYRRTGRGAFWVFLASDELRCIHTQIEDRFRPGHQKTKHLAAAKTEGFSKPSNNRTPSIGVRFVVIAHFQEFPDFPRRAARPNHMLPGHLDIALSHLDIRVAEDFASS